MKKIFFIALVALVAIGGAVTADESRTVTLPSGTLNGISCDSTEDNCTHDPSSNIECTNLLNQELFTTDPSTGNCDIPLFVEVEP